MFDNIWSAPSLLARRTPEEVSSFFYPDIEMSETDGHIDVSAELAGVDEKDIDVTLAEDGTVLTIRGEKKMAKERREKDYYCAERSYGSFRRTLGLPCQVDADKVDAKFKNGVLDIRLSKMASASKGLKHIDIKS